MHTFLDCQAYSIILFVMGVLLSTLALNTPHPLDHYGFNLSQSCSTQGM